MSELWRVLRDPRLGPLVVLSAAVLTGFGLVLMAWRGAAALGNVALQVPYLVSGAVIGLTLVGTGLVFLVVHLGRVEAATERRAVVDLQRDVLRLLNRVVQDDSRRDSRG